MPIHLSHWWSILFVPVHKDDCMFWIVLCFQFIYTNSWGICFVLYTSSSFMILRLNPLPIKENGTSSSVEQSSSQPWMPHHFTPVQYVRGPYYTTQSSFPAGDITLPCIVVSRAAYIHSCSNDLLILSNMALFMRLGAVIPSCYSRHLFPIC